MARSVMALRVPVPRVPVPRVPVPRVPVLSVLALQVAGVSERARPLLIACTPMVALRTSPLPNGFTFCRAAAGKAPKRPLGW